jgi:hypothetical protein
MASQRFDGAISDVNLGVREFQTASGSVDYGLFVGEKLGGVIDAKPEGATLPGYSEEAARYSRTYRDISLARRVRTGSNMWHRARRRCFVTIPTLIQRRVVSR